MLLKTELKKMFKSNGLKISVLCSLIIVACQTIWFIINVRMVNNYDFQQRLLDTGIKEKGMWFENGILEGWIGCEPFSPYNGMLFMILPLLAILPFGLSFYDEWKSGYCEHIITSRNIKEYIICKITVVFISGGIGAVFPLLLSLIVSACYLPAISTDVLALQSVLNDTYMFSFLYYDYPVFYALVYSLIVFVYGGIFSMLAFMVSRWMNNKFIILSFPLIVHVFLLYFDKIMEPHISKYNFAIFVNPTQNTGTNDLKSLIITTSILLIIIIGTSVLTNIRRETIS